MLRPSSEPSPKNEMTSSLRWPTTISTSRTPMSRMSSSCPTCRCTSSMMASSVRTSCSCNAPQPAGQAYSASSAPDSAGSALPDRPAKRSRRSLPAALRWLRWRPSSWVPVSVVRPSRLRWPVGRRSAWRPLGCRRSLIELSCRSDLDISPTTPLHQAFGGMLQDSPGRHSHEMRHD